MCHTIHHFLLLNITSNDLHFGCPIICTDIYYRLQRSCDKAMFLHLSVSHSSHRGGGVWQTPPGRQPSPRADTPSAATTAGGTHPTGMLSCSQCFFVYWHLWQCLIQSSPLANRTPYLSIIASSVDGKSFFRCDFETWFLTFYPDLELFIWMSHYNFMYRVWSAYATSTAIFESVYQ